MPNPDIVTPSRTSRISPYSWWLVVTGGALFAAVVLVLDHVDLLEPTWDILEPFLGLAVAGMATLVWLGERREARVAALPRRLTVRYLHEGVPVHTVERAVLLHEADARQLAQQIGGQIKREFGPPGSDAHFAFDARQIVEESRGPELTPDGEVYTVRLRIPLKSAVDAELFRRHQAGSSRPIEGGGPDSPPDA